MNRRDPQVRAALAAEYALGTLRGRARQHFEQQLRADARLRREVERWQNDLYPTFIDALPERQPAARVWRTIAAQTAPRPAPEPAGLWNSLTFWHLWSAFASAAALALALYLWLPQSSPLPADYVAVIDDEATEPAWLVQVDRAAQRLEVRALRAQTLAQERAFELWMLPDEGPPQSLGLIPARGGATLRVAPALLQRLAQADGLAVSLEPAGGSPTGLPTGPVLYQGKLLPQS